MRPNSFDRSRRIANSVILSALLTLVVSNVLFAFDVPYQPGRYLAVLAAAVAIFTTLLWIVIRHYPDGRLLVVLFCAVVMFGLSLLLQIDPVRESVAGFTGLSIASVQHVLADSLAETAVGFVIIVTVSLFITASSTSYTAQQRAAQLEETRAALLESEERFRQAFEDGPVGIALVDSNLQFVRVNRVLCDTLGYSEQELIGKSIEFTTHPEDVEATMTVARAIFRGEPPGHSFEKRYRKKDGSFFWGRLTALVVRDRDGNPTYALGMIENFTERKLMEEAQRRDHEFLRGLLDLQERERRFIAYEIHDGFVQQTVAAKMHLEAYLCNAESAPSSDTRQLELAVKSLDDAVNEGRRMIGELRPMIIDERGIVAAIDYLVSEGIAKKTLPIEFVHDVGFGRLDPLLEGTIFRITQEALANVRRHSNSAKALVKLDHTENEIHLEVRDWGIGFDPARLDASRFGVRGLQERALLFGGKATIDSKPGAGTRVLVELPIIHAPPSPTAVSLSDRG
jgi:PAS domain S-box-containing protein